MSESQQSLTSLREEGNALFAQKDFAGAYWIYTGAIQQDTSNPTLYANRAACLLPLRRFSEAREDSAKAVELDPGYTKWGRLAAANEELGDRKSAVAAYEKGLTTLTTLDTELSPMQNEMKEQMESKVLAAQKKAEVQHEPLLVHSPKNFKLETVPGTVNNGVSGAVQSSAWVAYSAYLSFSEGIGKIKKLKQSNRPSGETVYECETGTLEDLVKAILKDRRVVHIESKDWLEELDKQVHAESKRFIDIWLDVRSEAVHASIEERVRSDGWEKTSSAVSTRLSAWVIRGFAEASIGDDYDQTLYYLGSTGNLNAQRLGRLPFSRRSLRFRTFMQVAADSSRSVSLTRQL